MRAASEINDRPVATYVTVVTRLATGERTLETATSVREVGVKKKEKKKKSSRERGRNHG